MTKFAVATIFVKRLSLIFLALSVSTAATLLVLAAMVFLATCTIFRTRHLTNADNERFCLAIARLLIKADGMEVGERIQLAIIMLATYVEAKQVHFTRYSGPIEKRFDWAATPHNSVGSLDALVTVAASDPNWKNDILFVSKRSRCSPLKDRMRQEGVSSLLCVRAFQPVEVVLGFELNGCPYEMRQRINAVCMAFSIILEALKREILTKECMQVERDLARARRMETIGAMATGVAHNFNNIIGAISGFGEMAEAHTSPHSAARQYIGEIRHAVARARDLVDKILSFAKHQPRGHEIVPVPHLIGETARLFRGMSICSTELHIRLNGVSAFVVGSPAQIQQVLLNICSNAASADVEGKPIRLELSLCDLQAPRKLSHSTLDAGQYAIITVIDEGKGISSTALPRIFQPFFTTRPAGTGLGLSTAWEIVLEHGGTIDVYSALGEGSRFSIWLPVSSSEPLEISVPVSGEKEFFLHADKNAVTSAHPRRS